MVRAIRDVVEDVVAAEVDEVGALAEAAEDLARRSRERDRVAGGAHADDAVAGGGGAPGRRDAGGARGEGAGAGGRAAEGQGADGGDRLVALAVPGRRAVAPAGKRAAGED